MRLSVLKNDPGYKTLTENWNNRRNIKVFVDDIQVRRVITADEEEGFVEKYITCEAGNVIVENDEILKETLEGEVKIEIN